MNDNNYRKRFFQTYNKTHERYLDSDDQAKRAWFEKYVRDNYLRHIGDCDKKLRILEIGCNKGYVLEALVKLGFTNVSGVDLSAEDVDKARLLVPSASIDCADAFTYLTDKSDKFGIIILKAVLEHIMKKDVAPFLNKIKDSLTQNGKVIIDVPSMDWLFANHERYMDFTHEIGFTKESLRQVMSNVFLNVNVVPVDYMVGSSFIMSTKRTFARFLLTKLLQWADTDGASNPIWSRGIIGVGRK